MKRRTSATQSQSAHSADSAKRWRTLRTVFVLFATSASAQQTLGTVSLAGNTVSGSVSVSQSHATLQNTGTITAGAKAAVVALTRGGTVTVCTGSTVNLSQGNADKSPILFALQRGSFEVVGPAGEKDVILTADLRFDLSNAAPLDLRIRVTPEGDTCVENRGKDAPYLHVTEQFGASGYFVKAGQRVLFEHGSVREVVDREPTNCGCPSPATFNGNTHDDFPAAISQGLEQPHVPQATPGETHTQLSASVSYNAATEAAAAKPAPQAPPKQEGGNPFRAIGHFFKKIFGAGD